ncbi:MAG: hypothetical protein MSQ05_04115 [Akkermansia sp.]|nr:hypothetical protein [Akkermansia sp.]
MKVLNPLFFDALKEEAEKVKGNLKAADRFINRISTIRFFDPACGSANFLIVTFKLLRELEMEIIEATPGLMRYPRVNITQFYGIEIDDFAYEVAMLSMWLVDHQMNERFRAAFEIVVPTLPLKPNNNIVHGNALRLDWEKVCPKPLDISVPMYDLVNAAPSAQAEIYIFGNPPYAGKNKQTADQKEDLKIVLGHLPSYGRLDYVSCWFEKGKEYIYNTSAHCAFLSTNTIVQGEHVCYYWGKALQKVDISFAVDSFKWSNNAGKQAGVVCVIVGIVSKDRKIPHFLYRGDTVECVNYISPYLKDKKSVIVKPLKISINKLPPIVFGSMPRDNKNLILTNAEALSILEETPELNNHVKEYIGADDFLNGRHRKCLWFKDSDDWRKIVNSKVQDRFSKVMKYREKSKAPSTQRYADKPHLFVQRSYRQKDALFVPATTTERRLYIPMGYVNKNTVISNSAFAIYEAEPWVFAIIISSMHMAWVRFSCGRLGTGIRYSAELCYNTFPLREISAKEKELLNESAYNILDVRERHTEMTLGDMYKPESMPADLKQAHEENDRLVDSLYRKKPFSAETERLECLYDLYQQIIEEENEKHR